MNQDPMNFNLGLPQEKNNHWKIALGVIVPMLVVVGLLFLLVSYRGGIEAGVANLARLLPLGYAFGAGMVASVNPCGVLLLPSFAFSQLQGEEDEDGKRSSPFDEKPAAGWIGNTGVRGHLPGGWSAAFGRRPLADGGVQGAGVVDRHRDGHSGAGAAADA